MTGDGCAVLASPVGQLRVRVDEAGAVTEVRYLPADSAPRPPRATHGDRPPALAAALAALREYFSGCRTRFELPLAPAGSPFDRRVWAGLAAIGYGEQWSYQRLAEHIGAPGAARAVGAANGRNPIAILTPCHRVVGASGRLTGYSGGLAAKRYLLDHEQQVSGGYLC